MLLMGYSAIKAIKDLKFCASGHKTASPTALAAVETWQIRRLSIVGVCVSFSEAFVAGHCWRQDIALAGLLI